MLDQLWLIPLGFAGGVLGSMIGLGGGIIVVPILTFFGFSPTLAASNSLVAAFSNAAASTISYSRQKRIEYSLGVKLGLLTIPGTVLGAYVSSEVAPDIFKILFGFVLIASAIYIFARKKIEATRENFSIQMMMFAVGASFFAGIISAFFGIGGGIIFILGGYLAHYYGWRSVLWVPALIALIGSIWIMFALRDRPESLGFESPHRDEPPTAQCDQRHHRRDRHAYPA